MNIEILINEGLTREVLRSNKIGSEKNLAKSCNVKVYSISNSNRDRSIVFADLEAQHNNIIIREFVSLINKE